MSTINHNCDYDCIITHVPNYEYDGLTNTEWLSLVEYALEHLRLFNPNSYIILTGCGPKPKNAKIVQFTYWNDVDAPGQFTNGIQHAILNGFGRCLKTRGDCIVGIRNIAEYCDHILRAEEKSLLVTQPTSDNRLGDCFFYGDTVLSQKIWGTNPMVGQDLSQSATHNFRNAMGDDATPWFDLVRKHCAFRDANTLKFTCLYSNYQRLNNLDSHMRRAMLSPQFPFERYYYGKCTGLDNMLMCDEPSLWSANKFYQ